MDQVPYVLITAGGTSVPIDRVRSITNKAKGGFGVMLAKEFCSHDMKVVLLCTRTTQQFYDIPDDLNLVFYDTYDEYVAAIDNIIEVHGKPLCAISTAAVSDFGPEQFVEGKMVSGNDQLLALKPLPKVLSTWREKFGRECYIVGCKLTDRDDGFDDLLAAAQKQNQRTHINLTIANYNPWQQKCVGDEREVWLVKPDNGFLHVKGTHAEVTGKMISFIFRQMDTSWVRSVYQGTVRQGMPTTDPRTCVELHQSFLSAGRLLAFAKNTNLLHGSPGNVVVRSREDRRMMIVTPRAYPQKQMLNVDDLILVRIDFLQEKVDYWTNDASKKPSIDTTAHGIVFDGYARFTGAIHFHDGWVFNVVSTKEDFPCGSAQEGEAIRDTVYEADIQQSIRTASVMMELIRHGHVLYLDVANDLFRLEAEWVVAVEAYLCHLSDIGKRDQADILRLRPIFDETRIVGVAAQHRTEDWFSFFLLESARGRGLGEKLVQLAIERHVKVGVHADCHVEKFYVDHGFIEYKREDGMCFLQAPSKF